MKTQLQLIATTIALTVLIWVYADQSGHDSYQTTVLVRYLPPLEPEVDPREGARSGAVRGRGAHPSSWRDPRAA